MNKDNLVVLKQFIKRNGADSIVNSCFGKTLKKDQLAAVMYTLLVKQLIISFDTGLGKTVIASSLINLVTEKGAKALFILKRTTLDEMLKKIKESAKPSLRCGSITNESSVIDRMIVRQQVEVCDLLVISSDSLSNHLVNDYLFKNRDKIRIVIIDEMHLFANMESAESRLMSAIVQKAEYAVALTATPFQRDIIQLINTAYMLNDSIFGGLKPRRVYNMFSVYRDGKLVDYKNLDELKRVLKPIMFNVTREMLNVKLDKKCKINIVEPEPEWLNLKGIPAVKAIKGNINAQPYYKLCQLLTEHILLGRKGIVYINLNDIKEMVFSRLKELGYRVGLIDGSVSIKREHARTKAMYKSGEIDVLILNTVESADLEGDFAIFYELTQAYSQTIGRLSRDCQDKEIFIDFIIARGTYEQDFFFNNVYRKASLMSQLCDKSITELTLAVDELK